MQLGHVTEAEAALKKALVLKDRHNGGVHTISYYFTVYLNVARECTSCAQRRLLYAAWAYSRSACAEEPHNAAVHAMPANLQCS